MPAIAPPTPEPVNTITSQVVSETKPQTTLAPSKPATAPKKIQSSRKSKSELSFGPIRVERRSNSKTKAELVVSFPAGSVFSSAHLAAPERTVFDVKGMSLKGSRKVAISDTDLLSSIRFGAHEDMVRVVFDLSATGITSHQLGEVQSLGDRDSVLITIIGSGSPPAPVITTELVPTVSPTAAPDSDTGLGIAALAVRVLDASRILATPSPTPLSAAPLGSTGAVVPVPLAQNSTQSIEPPGSQMIVSLTFDHLQLESPQNSKLPQTAAPVVRVALAQRPQFKLSRRDDRSYRLVINDCYMGAKEQQLPQFPPADFEGLTILRAEQVGTAVEVIIGTERGVKLASVSKNNDILIRAVLP